MEWLGNVRSRTSRTFTLVFALFCIALGLLVSVRPAAGADDESLTAPPVVCDDGVDFEVVTPQPVVEQAAEDVEATEPDVPAECPPAEEPTPEEPVVEQPVVVEPTPAPAPVAEAPVVAEAPAPAAIVPAQLSEPLAPITDYANYPDPIFADIAGPNCNVDGHGIITGMNFTTDDGQTGPRLRDMILKNGQTVTMTWTGFAPGCENTVISFSAKRADRPTFDINENQELDVDSWVYCGTVQKTCASVNNTLILTMPAANVACSWQVDATIGPPLSIIGPDGTYYSPDVRSDAVPQKPFPAGKEMLLRAPGGGHDEAANNGGRPIADCAGRLPAAVEHECAVGGLEFELSNTGDIESEFDVVVDGGTPQHYAVGPLETVLAKIPAEEDSTHHVTITAEIGKVPPPNTPPPVTTLFDEDVLRDCEQVPPEPTITLTATPDCENDAPFLSYAATVENATPATITLHWFDGDGVERLTQADVPLSGYQPYPGVVLDGSGNPTDWPGWVKNSAGRWVEGADGFEWVRPTIFLTASFNPTSEPVQVDFPPGDPDCHPENPPPTTTPPPPVSSRQGLPRTGAEGGTFAELGLGLIGAGSLLLLASRRQRRVRSGWRHLAR